MAKKMKTMTKTEFNKLVRDQHRKNIATIKPVSRKVHTGTQIADHYAEDRAKKADWLKKKQMKKPWRQTDEHRGWINKFTGTWRNQVIRANNKKARKQMRDGLIDYRNTKFINEE